MKTSEFTLTSYRTTTFALLPSRAQHSALDRPDPTRGGLLVGLTISESNMNGSSHLSPMTWSSHRMKRRVSASLAGEVFMLSEGLEKRRVDPGSVGNRQSSEITAHPCTDDDVQFTVSPIVTVMKGDSAIHLDPSIVCIVDAKSAFDHLIRESSGGHGRRTAEGLCVFRRSMQALRVKRRCVPDSMIADALTKRHGNSVTTLKFLKRTTFCI